MRDRVPLFNKKNNVVILDLTDINSFADLKAANDNGALRGDIYSNNDGEGTQVIGSPYSKQNVLPQALTTKLGIEDVPSEPADALNRLADASLSEMDDITLSAANWVGDEAPFTYTITDARIRVSTGKENKIEILPTPDIPFEQLEVLQNANIIGGEQLNGSMTLLAYGMKPAVDVPIRIIFGGDVDADSN